MGNSVEAGMSTNGALKLMGCGKTAEFLTFLTGMENQERSWFTGSKVLAMKSCSPRCCPTSSKPTKLFLNVMEDSKRCLNALFLAPFMGPGKIKLPHGIA